MAPPPDPRQNHLLAALPLDEYQRLAPLLQPVELKLGDSLAESGETMCYGYFPTDSIVSLRCEMEDGNRTEVAVVGAEGVIGVSLFMGGDTTPIRAIVRNAGSTYRLKAALLKSEFDRAGPLQDLLLRYTQSLLAQISQISVCNRHHSLDQQLCRWLLLSLDRIPTDELIMTHELIANLIGVRRESITISAGRLQKAGLISCSRGRINFLDRPGLEEMCCECYEAITEEYQRLMSYRRPPRDKGYRWRDCSTRDISQHGMIEPGYSTRA
ncbi:MAG: Crp/Fnr family transcriptional regulator [Halomonas sp.]|uniref:Crp/Fnr family transcriptional regulator n=1 Tax=Halomonas sp. TaxID=1486246 RepID=UPI001A072ACC|nr:Crp/Fnr family transcriptional regulator [Halomonas sp.]MBE0488930.1 Crp/Fnr family transcriptional regulator [Halomonas sp.]